MSTSSAQQPYQRPSREMAGMRYLPWFVVLVLALASGLAPASGFELNGRALGDRIDEVLADERYDCGGVSACFLLTACSFKAAAGEVAYGAPLTSLTLHYLGERMAAIEARFPPARFDAVVDAALREHGPAAQSAAEPGVYVWRQGTRLLRLERAFAGGESSLIITQQSLLGELLPQAEKPE